MDSRTLEILDYYRIRDGIADLCVSEEGRSALMQQEPFSPQSKAELLRRKTLGRQWLAYLGSGRKEALNAWPPVRPHLAVLGISGASLAQEALHAVGLFCRSALGFAAAVRSAAATMRIQALSELSQSIPDLSAAEREIFRVLNADGTMRDLPELRELRARIASLRRETDALLRKHIADPRTAQALQDTVPVLKSERQVLAVRSDHRAAVPGIVHEVSHSGQTVFIEPEDVVRKNNELVEEEFRLQQETARVLRELTGRIAEHRDALAEALPALVLADMTCAAARQCRLWSGVFPSDTEDAPVIIEGRHPLLCGRAVPVTVRVAPEKRVLVITGPNTGGKTVTMKMTALFAALSQSGFPVPAEEGTALPMFSGIFADIGDEQSMDKSLSTFSAHLRTMAALLARADSSSLILLDEPGNGTDPQEGCAIAMAVLDEIIEKKALALVTTHHGALKNYGYTRKECTNASVEFDAESLRPTYRLRMGIPGESHAIEIAKASGFSPSVLNRARSYLVSQQADVSELINGLTQKHAEFDMEQEEFRKKKERLSAKQSKLERRELELRRRELELKEKSLFAENAFVSQSRRELENLVRHLREGEITREKTLAVRDFINKIEKKASADEAKLDETVRNLQNAEAALERREPKGVHSPSNKPTRHRVKNKDALLTAEPFSAGAQDGRASAKAPPIGIGTNVLAGKEKRGGTVVAADGRGRWQVQLGSLRMSFSEKDLTALARQPLSADSAEFQAASTFVTEEKPVFELRLLGMRAEEAVAALQKQLDLCTVSNFRSFSVIHGKGNGILQQAVHDYLSHYPAVADYQFAPPEDGGTGKTYVTLQA